MQPIFSDRGRGGAAVRSYIRKIFNVVKEFSWISNVQRGGRGIHREKSWRKERAPTAESSRKFNKTSSKGPDIEK